MGGGRNHRGGCGCFVSGFDDDGAQFPRQLNALGMAVLGEFTKSPGDQAHQAGGQVGPDHADVGRCFIRNLGHQLSLELKRKHGDHSQETGEPVYAQ